MRTGIAIIVLFATGMVDAADSTPRGNSFHTLVYHDVRDRVADDIDPDQYAVSTNNLVAHFSWLRANGYTPVSIDDLIAARDGAALLPKKAVLLTFDDGLKSVYTHVFPLLRLFEYPAVVSVVTDWVERREPVIYADRSRGHGGFLTWAEIREMQQSGLVEIASHSHNLHRGMTGNPQGNLQPAAVTRLFQNSRYESESEYSSRVMADLERSIQLIKQETGTTPRVLAWPYGHYNKAIAKTASDLGMAITLALTSKENDVSNLGVIHRHLFEANPGISGISEALLPETESETVRVAQVDLDYVYDPDNAQQENNLSALLDRIKELEISHVYLQAFADPDGDGAAHALYFPNRHMPLRADLFNRVAWQLLTRAEVEVYAWMPMLAFVGDMLPDDWYVTEDAGSINGTDAKGEPRLSPFHPVARRFIAEIYEDLAVHAAFTGILFHDDGRLNEFEDASPTALAYYRNRLGPDFSIVQTQKDPGLRLRWTQLKTEALSDFSDTLAATVRHHRPNIRTARNLFAPSVLDPDSQVWLAQSYTDFLARYNYTALMAMPGLEGIGDTAGFYDSLVRQVIATQGGIERTIFELQTVEWPGGTPIPAQRIRDRMRKLQSMGIRHIGYYPDDFIQNHPDLEKLRQGISLAEYPYRR